MKDEKKAPKLRFKGFTDDWEQRKLGDVAKITAGGDINKGDLINKGKYPVIANGLNNNGIVGYSNKYKIDAPAVTITGRGTLGVATARFINFTPIVRLISIKSDLDPIYLENVINNTHFVIESTGVPQLTAPQVKRQTVILSNCHIEQTKIGSLFLTLDNAITLHEEKKRQLERLKSALLQKMFADKSGYPAVRFEGFGGKWDQCKLGNVGTFRGGFGFPENEQGNIDGIAFYKVSDMNDSCNTLTMRKASNYVTSSQISKNKWKPILNQNIIFAKVGAAVYLERKRKAMGPFLLDNNMMAFQPKDADIDYIYYVFQRLRISKHAQVGTLPSLNASELRNITIYIPSLNEQKAVADLMVSLDHTIILYDFKLELLKKLKSSLLQHMFI
uniref:restriction endonuclease subunit S n=1 Tax=Lactobacillus delbrueckii TaxID=1584 RepID=UPI0030C860D2